MTPVVTFRRRMQPARWKRQVGKAIVVFALFVATSCSFGVSLLNGSQAAADQESWVPGTAPLPGGLLPDGLAPQATMLEATSCSSSNFCVAVGAVSPGASGPYFPLAAVYTAGSWTSSVLPLPPDADPNGGSDILQSVSCAVDGSCAAVGEYSSFDTAQGVDYQSGLIESLSQGTWTPTPAAEPDGPDTGLVNMSSVSCSDASDCVAVGQIAEFMNAEPDDDYGVIYTLAAGDWNMQTAPVPPGASDTEVSELAGVSCPDVGECVAVGDYYVTTIYDPAVMTLTLSGGIWTASQAPVPSNVVYGWSESVWLNSIDCPQVGTCVAGGSYTTSAAGDYEPYLLTLSSGEWTAAEGPIPTDLTHGLILGMFCPAVGECYATGYGDDEIGSPTESGIIWTYSNGSWSAADAPLPPGTQEPTVPSQAAQLSPQGATAHGNSSGTTSDATAPPDGSSLAGVSCATDGFCAAAGTEQSSGLLESATVSSLPMVTGISPTSGPVAGSTQVTVTGSSFDATSVVSFGGVAAPTTFVSSSELEAQSPATPTAAPVDVTVTTDGLGSRANPDDLFYYYGKQKRVAGYDASPSTAATQTALTTFSVPTAYCSGIPVGGRQKEVEGAQIETSTGTTLVGVTVACNGPHPVYGVTAEVNGVGTAVSLNVSPGSTVTASASESTSETTLSLTKGTKTRTVSGSGGAVSEEDVGVFSTHCSISNCDPVPRSTATQFSGTTIDGLNPTQAGSLVSLKDAAGALQVAARKTGHEAFQTAWVASCGTTANC